MLRPRIAWRDTGCLFRRSGRRRGEGPGRNGPVLWGPARNRTPGRALQGPVGLSTRQVSHPLDAKLRVGRPMASSLVAPQSGTFCLHIEMRRTKRKRTERWQRLAANRATPPHFQPISPLRTRRLFPYRIRSTIVNTHETPFRGDFAAGCYGIGRRSFRHAKHSRLSHLWPQRRNFWTSSPSSPFTGQSQWRKFSRDWHQFTKLRAEFDTNQPESIDHSLTSRPLDRAERNALLSKDCNPANGARNCKPRCAI